MKFRYLDMTLKYILGITFLCAQITTQAAYSPYPLEIFQPRAGLDINNRFYRAYPGLQYQTQVATVGGAYPYTYGLSGPSGMTINEDTGVITWPNPPASAIPYDVSTTVTDSESNTSQVAWTITVTTEKFLFVDAVNGTSNATGTIDDPLKTFVDVYGGTTYADKYSDKRADHFVYFKTGTYFVDGYTGGQYKLQYTAKHPMVLMAYPGESPVLDMSQHCVWMETQSDNFYVEGFEVTPISGPENSRFAFRIGGNSNDVTLRNNYFHNLDATSGSNNQAVIMATKTSTSGSNWAVQNNRFEDIYHGYGIIGYTVENLLFADNMMKRFDDPTGTSSHPIGPKEGTSKWFIRNNRILNSEDHGIWLFYNSDSHNFGDIEISYNMVQMDSDNGLALSVNQTRAESGGAVHVFRNTFIGNITLFAMGDNVGPIAMKDNVVINSMASTIVCESCYNMDNVSNNGQLEGSTSDNIVDRKGDLIGQYTNRVGLVGYQVSGSSIKSQPLAPNSLKAIHRTQ
ncbi:MAG: Ig domain-containing protein [Pseudomonadales bacterium]